MDNVWTVITLLLYLTAQAGMLIWKLSAHDTSLKQLTIAVERLERSIKETDVAAVEARIAHSALKGRVNNVAKKAKEDC